MWFEFCVSIRYCNIITLTCDVTNQLLGHATAVYINAIYIIVKMLSL